jgi:2-oxo-4-hydroxy-4-carboxy-5-ureidoimidazoline decarboxylase
MYCISDLNQMGQEPFVAALGAIFEETPAIAQQAWLARPFVDVADLHGKMVAVVHQMPAADQLTLIRAHPDLGSRVKMAPASIQEQAGVGLDRLSPEEFDRFQGLNEAYKARFGFPFIIAVKHQTKASILAAFTQRLENSPATEQQQALAEIAQIARLRLDAMVQ